MFDFGVGYTELLVIAVVALIVVGPKDLPKLLRHLGQFTASVRRMAGEFQRHLDEVAREADVDKVTSEIREATKIDLGEGEIRKAAADLRTALENTTPAADPHAPATASSPPSTAAPSPGAGAPASLPEAAVPEITATEVPPPEVTAPEVTPQPAPADKAPDRAL
ncbi:MAG TPA: Sec-independent protein translocase protein TatB [Aestuariivirgaceae bacterium]|jgi:sec-independent protein translocase protein TatB|nr:Sec-independent protein translocase protein TatB [Aestuariivirgaceae bacterium]